MSYGVAEKILGRVDGASFLERFEAIHRAALLFGPVDGFYVCRFDAIREKLRFVYNVEGDQFDTPEEFPLGNGPTSRAVRWGRSVTSPDDGSDPGQTYGSPRRSASALHAPMAGHPVEGVLGFHSDSPNAFEGASREGLEWLASRATGLVRDPGDIRAAGEERARWRRDGAHAVAARAVTRLQELDAVVACETLRRELRRLQIDLPSWAEGAAPVRASLPGWSECTSRERSVIRAAARGLTNGAISKEVNLAPDTVKRHLSNAFSKLGFINGRVDAARYASQFPSDPD